MSIRTGSLPYIALGLIVCYFLATMAVRLAVAFEFMKKEDRLPRWADAGCLILALVIIGMLLIPWDWGCGVSAERNSTSAFHRGIMSALENYRSDYGEYPSPKAPEVRAVLDGHDYDMSGALMLYQALSGDGDDHIRSANGGHTASDGRVSDSELKNVFLKEMPKEMVLKTDAGYILADGFGHPF